VVKGGRPAKSPHHYSWSQRLVLPMGAHIIGTDAAGDRPDPVSWSQSATVRVRVIGMPHHCCPSPFSPGNLGIRAAYSHPPHITKHNPTSSQTFIIMTHWATCLGRLLGDHRRVLVTILHSYFRERHFPDCLSSLIQPLPGAGSRERVLAYREVEAILIYDRRIGMVSFW